MNGEYTLEGDGFHFTDYQRLPPFSSFLPGLCGVYGVPLWCFYVNRGQGVAAFGVDDKDHAVMEFSPAVIAYEDTARKGFRTFARVDGERFEAFEAQGGRQIMTVLPNALIVEEERAGLRFRVEYAMLPEERLGALMRTVTVENPGSAPRRVELADGMARVLPYGASNAEFKEMANLLKSYTAVRALSGGGALFAVRAGVADSAEVDRVEGGYFCVSASDGENLPLICDPAALFGQDTALGWPENFYDLGAEELLRRPQYCDNKIPCAFSLCSRTLGAGEMLRVDTLIGFAPKEEALEEYRARFADTAWLEEKRRRADALPGELTDEIETHTAQPVFDAYLRQCYLDNALRGGWPCRRGAAVLHLFSRKHGDLERDYNFFRTQAVHCSQGDGNFRDVCQNRRSEVLFHPEIGEYDLFSFAQLIQIDGYNPLELRPEVFRLRAEREAELAALCCETFGAPRPRLAERLQIGLTPGELASAWLGERAPILSEQEFLDRALALCTQEQQAVFKEGYWSDHWTYVPDLADSCFAVWPERRRELLFERKELRFYNSPAMVLPRSKKHCLKNGAVRQYGATTPDPEKSWGAETRWLKNADGTEAKVTLFAKFLLLAAIKCATLDPLQLGLEMEAGKPGWNDAFNGLPGLCGSSTSETANLLALVERLETWLADAPTTLGLPEEIADFCRELQRILKGTASGYALWDAAATLREDWRAKTRTRLSGREVEVSGETVRDWLARQREVLEGSLTRLGEYGEIPPTYFVYEATRWEELGENTPYGLPAVRVTEWEGKPLPVYLETPAKLVRRLEGENAERMYSAIRGSELYDEKLGMYKTSGSIEGLSHEVGRIRAFTPGWFERESIFLHMEYKYLLSLFDAGLHDIAFREMRKLLIPFLDPAIYGRSTLENSSFLASSANPDPATWGRGFISRLSGSTAEVISLWQRMFLGDTLFHMRDGELAFGFSPVLPHWLFDEKGELSFRFLDCRITYRNPTGRSGRLIPARMELEGRSLPGGILGASDAVNLRKKKTKAISVIFK